MTWNVTAEPTRFDEAVAFFAEKVPLTDGLVAELAEHAGPRAWTISGVTQLEVVQSVHDSLERAIASGIPYDEWAKQVEPELTKAWGRKNSSRLETIFINATQQSYNAGRWEQMLAPEVRDLRPFGFFDDVEDSRETDICRALGGTILPLEEFAERGLCPQLHHRCRSQIRGIRPSDAARRGGVTTKLPDVKPADGFGEIPTRAAWQPDASKHDPKLWAEYQRKAADIAENAKRPAIKVD